MLTIAQFFYACISESILSIPFIDLKTQQARIGGKIDTAIKTVLEHGRYILGPEVTQLEGLLVDFENMGDSGGKAIGCANGTDAIILPLMAMNIGPGDAVFCPSFTYTATAEAIAVIGATPVFVDVDRELYTLDAASLSAAIEDVNAKGDLTPRAVITVDLFGQPADYPAISKVTQAHGLSLISDCAQGFGCRLGGKSPLHWADAMTTSFFPAKPLGCYGDGGAVMVKTQALEDKIRSLAFHGRGSEPYDHDAIGINSRLDSIQAAILIEKLAIFDDEIKARNRAANYYTKHLKSNVLRVPRVIEGGLSTWAQYAIEVPNRDAFLAAVRAQDVPVAAYYPRPTHLQSAYTGYPVASSGLAATEDAMTTIAALPIHPYLDEATQDIIIKAVKAAL